MESISSNENLPNLDNKQYQKVHAPLVNTQQSIQSGQQFHQQYNESRYDDGNEADEENDAYLESRYSDDGEEPKTCGEEEYDDEGGEELDADPSEFGVTVTKL
ncbi:hypothetical protein TRFO_40616 [Tritrichomonas foetus]|uniref:Uncharacterized protein n=1 Tax=Tritrichomonas foetus TaxID=1144522 RepID=A0A1J4J7B9_9EUKA|nr:hypothetical protein TRFO_40616 [Tritrichomonas foetus]|eukprot:OHS93092.1 hypothetical protein TRFO_40616 [Tritrichomonas foetus]